MPSSNQLLIFNEYSAISTRDQLVSQLGIELEVLKGIDGPFLDRVGSAIWGFIQTARNRRYSNAREWRDGLPTFITGGGASEAAYGERLDRLSNDMIKNGMGGLIKRPLPKPQRFHMEGVLNEHFNRLAVAYGLANDPLDLGDFIPTSQIQDEPPRSSTINFRERFIGPEQT